MQRTVHSIVNAKNTARMKRGTDGAAHGVVAGFADRVAVGFATGAADSFVTCVTARVPDGFAAGLAARVSNRPADERAKVFADPLESVVVSSMCMSVRGECHRVRATR